MPEKVMPIKPSEVKSTKPDVVIEIFNGLIKSFWDGTEAHIKQEDAAALIARRMNISQKEVFNKHYLDIESIYRQAGWEVTYSKPAYNETPYDPYFIFRKGDKCLK